jgi:hypothetical protein
MTESELQAEKKAEAVLVKEEARLKKEAEIQELRDDLGKTYDGTFKSIHNFMEKYTWRNSDDTFTISAEQFKLTFAEKSSFLRKKELGHFLSVGVKLVKKGVLTFEYFKNCVSSVEERKEEDNFA